jgi:hypothetical protein
LETTATYKVEELHNALRIKVHKKIPLWERLVLSFGLAALIGSVSFTFLGWWSILLGFATAISLFILVTGMNAQLYATKLEFVSTGDIGRRGGRGQRIVCTADVHRLEFRDPAGLRSGLYAVTERKGHCILPFLDYLQTTDVIRAIENKFPGLAEYWRENEAAKPGSLFSDGLRGMF